MDEIKRFAMLLALMAVSFGVLNACKEEIDNPDGEDDGHPSVTRITLDGNSPRAAMGLTLENMTGHTFKVGSSKVEPQRDGQGWYIDYVKEDYLKGVIMWEGASMPFSDRRDDENARIPFSQFHQTTLEIMKSYPLFARKDKNGNFKFKDAFAMLDLNITGSASINSIKVRRLDGGALSADGLDFVVLNCVMQDGNPSSLPGHFMIPVKAGTYRGGLEITICDSKGRMRRMISDTPATGAGETLKLDMVYSPTPSVYFYAGFDNCVWGSDPYGLMQGYAPDSKDPGKDGRADATGYEPAYEKVPSGQAGTGLIQTEAADYDFAMTESYLKSRGFDKWKYMLRVKEFQGCVGVGVGYTSRGWVHTPVLSDIPAGSDVKLSFRFKVDTGADENIEIKCEGGGSFVGVILDSGLESKISGTSYVLDVEGLEEGWHDMSLVVTGASSQTSFRVGGNLKNSGVTHGFFIDDIYVRKVEGPMSDIPGISSLDQLSTVELSFKMKFDKYASEGLTISLPTGGFLCGMTVDSQPVADNVTGRTGWPLMTEVTLDPAGYYDQEHEVVLKIESADKDMTVLFKGDACSCSDMVVRKVSSIEKKSFRLLLWNIQFGMWADQGNNYDNFVAWLKKYDADCCVFVEAETVYKDGSSEGEPAYLKKLNGSSGGTYGWSELAPRYGHSYMKVSADNDNYSQEITSNNRSLAVVSKLPGTFYGSGHFSINTGDRTINIVTYHGMPYNFDPKYKNTDGAEKEESASKREGDVYRLNEVKYLVGQTFGNSNYSSEKNWIFLGDMNSHSPADNWYYEYISTGILAAQDYIIQSSGLRDVIAEKYPGRFLPTTVSGKFRIDYVYVSDAMMSAVTNAVVIRDKWTSEKATAVDGFTHPSDHRPILVDFKF